MDSRPRHSEMRTDNTGRKGGKKLERLTRIETPEWSEAAMVELPPASDKPLGPHDGTTIAFGGWTFARHPHPKASDEETIDWKKWNDCLDHSCAPNLGDDADLGAAIEVHKRAIQAPALQRTVLKLHDASAKLSQELALKATMLAAAGQDLSRNKTLIVELQQEVARLLRGRDWAYGALEVAEKKLAELQLLLAELQAGGGDSAVVAGLREEVRTLREELSAMEDQMLEMSENKERDGEAGATIAGLKAELAEMVAQMAKESAAKAELEQKVEKRGKQTNSWREKWRVAKEETDGCKDVIYNMERTRREDMAALSRVLDDWATQFAPAQSKAQVTARNQQPALSSVAPVKVSSEHELTSLLGRLTQLRSDATCVAQERDQAKNALATADEQHSAELQALQFRLQQAEELLAAEQHKFSVQRSKAESRAETAAELISQLTRDLKASNERTQHVKGQLQKATEQTKEFVKRCVDMARRNADLEQQLKASRLEVAAAAELRAPQLAARTEAAEKKVAALETDLTASQSELLRVTEESERRQALLSQASAEVETLRVRMAAVQNKCIEGQKATEELLEDFRSAHEQIKELQAAAEAAEQTVVAVEQQLSDTQQRLQAADQCIATLKQQLTEAEQRALTAEAVAKEVEGSRAQDELVMADAVRAAQLAVQRFTGREGQWAAAAALKSQQLQQLQQQNTDLTQRAESAERQLAVAQQGALEANKTAAVLRSLNQMAVQRADSAERQLAQAATTATAKAQASVSVGEETEPPASPSDEAAARAANAQLLIQELQDKVSELESELDHEVAVRDKTQVLLEKLTHDFVGDHFKTRSKGRHALLSWQQAGHQYIRETVLLQRQLQDLRSNMREQVKAQVQAQVEAELARDRRKSEQLAAQSLRMAQWYKPHQYKIMEDLWRSMGTE